MRWRVFGCVVATAAVLQGCSDGPRGPGQREAAQFSQGIAGGGRGVRPGPGANEAYVAGLEKRKSGDCKGAIELVRPVANLGPGYEGAQFALGDCLSRLAAGPNAPEHHEGVMWLLRAADGGWTEAQGRLAELYVFGAEGVRNPAEGAYWLALYQLGAALPRFGFEPMPAAAVDAIAKGLTPAEREAGQARAATWQKKAWIPPQGPASAATNGSPAQAGGRVIRRGPRGADDMPN